MPYGCSAVYVRRMFILTEMQDIIRIEPRRFGQDTGQEIVDVLNKKFANKVAYRVTDNRVYATTRL